MNYRNDPRWQHAFHASTVHYLDVRHVIEADELYQLRMANTRIMYELETAYEAEPDMESPRSFTLTPVCKRHLTGTLTEDDKRRIAELLPRVPTSHDRQPEPCQDDGPAETGAA